MKRSTMNTLAVAVLSLCVHSASASIFGISGGHSFERRQSPGGDAVCEQFSTATIANIAIFPEFVSNASAFCQTLSGGELPSAILPASAVPLPLPGTNGDTTSQFTSLCSIATVRADEAEGIVPANTAEPTSALAVIEFTNTIPADVAQAFTVEASVSVNINIGPTNTIQNSDNIAPYDGSSSLPAGLQALFPNLPRQWYFNETNTYQDSANIPISGVSASYSIPAECKVTAALFVDEVQYRYIADTDLCMVGAYVCDFTASTNAIKYYTSMVETVRELDAATKSFNTCQTQRGGVLVQYIPSNPQVVVYENNDACGGRVIAQQLAAGIQIPTAFQFPVTTQFENVVTEVEVATDTSTVTQTVVSIDETDAAERPAFDIGA